MKNLVFGLLSVLTWLAFSAGCDSADVCDPGETELCFCESGNEGAQECAASGDAWEECACGASPECGDTICASNESCATCSQDCGPCQFATCGDGVCEAGDCPADCAGSCDLIASYNGSIPCFPLGPKGTEVAGSLVTLWEDGPQYICGYSGAAPPQTSCGPTTPGNAMYCSIDLGISLDFDWLNSLDAQFGGLASVVVFAHEWGHRNQHVLGVLNGSNIFTELHADCQAGLYTAAAELSGMVDGSQLLQAFNSLCSVGDPAGTPWFAPGAHGSCQQRVEAFQAGYEGAKSVGACNPSDPLGVMLQVCGSP